MEFRFLGPFDVVDDQRIVPIVGGKQRALLAILALHANEVVPVGRLIDDLWPDEPPDSALNSIQAYVSRLRKALNGNGTGSGAETIVFRHGGYMLDVSAEQIDARRFARLVEDGERRIDAGDVTEAAGVLREALGLWRGPALSDFAHERFAQPEIARLEELRLKAVEDRIDADLASGRDAALVPELEALIAEHPLRERLRRQLMLALYRCGRQGDALTVYRETRATLDAELGVEPTPELRELELAILRQDEALGPVHRPRTSPASVRARRWLWVAGVAVVAAVAILAVAVLRRPDGGSPAAVRVVRNSVAVVDAATNQIVDDVVVGDYPGPIAAGNGSVWVGNIGANTMTEIDASTRDAEFPAGVQRPLDIAVTRDAVWVANSSDFEMTPPAGGGTVERRGMRFGALTTAQVGTPGHHRRRAHVRRDGRTLGVGGQRAESHDRSSRPPHRSGRHARPGRRWWRHRSCRRQRVGRGARSKHRRASGSAHRGGRGSDPGLRQPAESGCRRRCGLGDDDRLAQRALANRPAFERDGRRDPGAAEGAARGDRSRLRLGHERKEQRGASEASRDAVQDRSAHGPDRGVGQARLSP